MAAGARRRAVSSWAQDLPAPNIARDLGVEYLARYPAEADDGALRSRLSGLEYPMPFFTRTEEVQRCLGDQLRNDFETGDLVRIGGAS